MNSWKVILATLVIFGAGVVTGGLLVSYAVRANTSSVQLQPQTQFATKGPGQPQGQFQGQGLTPWQMRNRELVRRMDRELDLTSAQHERIEKIIADSQDRTKNLWKPIVPQMAREMQHVNALIRDELTTDQQKKYDELFKPRRKNDDPSRPGPPRRTTNVPSLEVPAGAPAPQ